MIYQRKLFFNAVKREDLNPAQQERYASRNSAISPPATQEIKSRKE